METTNVAIRIRPSFNVLDDSVGIEILSKNVLYVKDRPHYKFDRIYSEDVEQKEIYDEMVKPLLDKVLSGYNSTVFAYGQTGTGKTYTIGSDPEAYPKDAGFITRALDEVFDNQEEHIEINVSVSFFEIYNEKVFDLLCNNKTALPVKGCQVQGLTQTIVKNSFQARELLKSGSKQRHTGHTKQNRNSSRSHAIFTIHCNVKHDNFETDAKLNLVDLAGSESVRKTGCKGSQFQEGVNINKGLFHIGGVINALSTDNAHVPYRNSVLTLILQDSLDKRNNITFVACISPDLQDMNETVQTLQFVQGTKKIRITPEENNIVQQHKKENPSLFERQIPGSAIKRPHYQSLQYSATKKSNVIPNHSWTPSHRNTEPIARVSPTSLISMSVSSISTISDVTPAVMPSLSPFVRPIVQKYAEALECTMMKKMQVFMDSHLRRPIIPDVSDTPQFSWQRLQSEVTQIVKNEIIHYTGRKSPACSSPIIVGSAIPFPAHHNISDVVIVAKRLEFDEEPPCLEQIEQAEPSVFKVPTAFPRKIITPKKKTPIEDDTILATELNDDFVQPSTSQSANPTPRRSIRLSLRKLPSPPVEAVPVNRRQSTRISMKRQLPSEPSTATSEAYPTPAPRKKVKATDGSPASNHSQYVLNILNTGNQKELQKLPSIGAKTAAQIFFYRQLNGQFNTIADFGKMESWRGTGYQRFLKANFLKVEED